MYIALISALIAFLVTFISVPVLIRKFSNVGIVGKDVHKAEKPEIPEMGGLAIVAGFIAAILFAVGATTLVKHQFIDLGGGFVIGNLLDVFAAICTILIITIIGIFDDLVKIRQSVKATLPLFASFPLVAIAAGNPYISLPLLGRLHLPILYPLVMIPLGITIVANLTNMFAGFNGMEAGLGIVMGAGLLPIAYQSGSVVSFLILVCLVSSLLAFLFYNRFPSKIFAGDVGTLFIGASIASAGIIGNFETALVIVMLPYILDFIIKAKNRFPSTGWWGTLMGDKLVCEGNPVGLAQYILKVSGGLSERRLVFVFVLLELPFVLLAISFYIV